VSFAHTGALETAGSIVDVDKKVMTCHSEPSTVRTKLHVANYRATVLLRHDFCPSFVFVNHETSTIETDGDQFTIGAIRARARSTRDISHANLSSEIHVIRSHCFIIASGDKFSFGWVAGQPPKFRIKQHCRTIDSVGMTLSDDSPVPFPRIFCAKIKLIKFTRGRAD
jgi:hypothetical protein